LRLKHVNEARCRYEKKTKTKKLEDGTRVTRATSGRVRHVPEWREISTNGVFPQNASDQQELAWICVKWVSVDCRKGSN